MTYPNPIPVSVVMMDALAQAERLAHANPESHACVYRDKIDAGAFGRRIYVRTAEEPAPDNAELVTTVVRRTPEVTGGFMGLQDAVKQVLGNLPAGVRLHGELVVEHYPPEGVRRHHPGETHRVFAYQFMTTEMRNIATWIPDVAIDGVQMQLGFDGRGRPWKNGSIVGESTRNIGWMIKSAMVQALDPGECTYQFEAGWRMAEEFLRGGASASDDPPRIDIEEKYKGFIGRMARERDLSQQAPAQAQLAAAQRRPRM